MNDETNITDALQSSEVEAPVKRRPGRPKGSGVTGRRKRRTRVTRTAPPVIAESTATAPPHPPPSARTSAPPDLPVEEMEKYGGDLAAWDAWSPRSGVRMARHTDYEGGTIGMFQPNLMPPGVLVYRHDPTKKFHFKLWDEDSSQASRASFGKLRSSRCKPATTADFQVHPDYSDVIVPDATGRLTFAPSKSCVTVVMYQGEEDYRRDRAALTRASDEIQKTVEERAATSDAKFAREGMGGMRSGFTIEDDPTAAEHFRR